MIVIDEYLAVRVVFRDWPPALPVEELVLPTSRHWRILQALHGGRGGQLSRLLAPLGDADRDALRHPHPDLIQVLDPRPLLDDAAILAARFGGGWLIAETLAAGLAHGQALWFGSDRNIGPVVAGAAAQLGVTVRTA